MELALITGLILKHTIADYFMQYSWMIRDKGTYGAWGGVPHSIWHAILTGVTLSLFNILTFNCNTAIFDGVIHYHVDYVKSNVWKTKGYTSQTQMYWITHGVDPTLHLLTYVAIVALCV